MRERSYEGKLTTPARWKRLAMAPAGTDADSSRSLSTTSRRTSTPKIPPPWAPCRRRRRSRSSSRGAELRASTSRYRIPMLRRRPALRKEGRLPVLEAPAFPQLRPCPLPDHRERRGLHLHRRRPLGVTTCPTGLHPVLHEPALPVANEQPRKSSRPRRREEAFSDIHTCTTSEQQFFFSTLYLSDARGKPWPEWFRGRKRSAIPSAARRRSRPSRDPARHRAAPMGHREIERTPWPNSI